MAREAMLMQCQGFHVRITADAFRKIRGYIKLCPTEVSGFGKVKTEADGLLITDVFLIPQKVSSVTTELDPQALYDAVNAASQQGEDTSEWGLWFHSHVNMVARMSSVDTDTIDLLGSSTPLISLVMNKSGEYECRVDFYEPFRMTLRDVKVEVVYEPDDSLMEECKKELQENVTPAMYRLAKDVLETDPDLPPTRPGSLSSLELPSWSKGRTFMSLFQDGVLQTPRDREDS